MDQFGALFYFSFTLAYAVDSYQANTSEMLIAMNLGKQSISFGMGIYLLDWILKDGFAVTISGIFTAVLFYGKKIRIFMSKTWLARLHRGTIKSVEVA
jgi:uncharacterized membrane protein